MSRDVTESGVQFFHQNGYLTLAQFLDVDTLGALQRQARIDAAMPTLPLELETDTGYPGAPASIDAFGGRTPRRLLQAYARHPLYRAWATHPDLQRWLRRLFQHPSIFLSQAHHNCLMTKNPQFSSDTGWHQDLRYWQFSEADLISVWLALGDERVANGALWVIPGTHALPFDRAQFDEHLFFRADVPGNQALIAQALPVELTAGDVLLFHARLLHSASRNHTQQTKLSLVFTYHDGDNQPLPNTRSSRLPEIPLGIDTP